MKQINYLYLALLAFVVDAVTFVASQFVLPGLVPLMQKTGGTSAIVLGGTFILFITGVFLFRRMKATPGGSEEWLSRGWRVAMALFFSFIISLALAWQLGYFQSAPLVDTTQMGEGGASSYFVYGPGAWLAFSLIYVLVFAFRVTPKIDYGRPGYVAAALFGLVAANAMLIVFVAQARAFLLVTGAAWWWVILALLVLILMFGPPRLLYLTRTIGLKSPAAYGVIAIFLLILGVYATQMIITIF